SIVSLTQLDSLDAGAEVSSASLIEQGLAHKGRPVKILSNGEISKAVTVTVEKISAGAKAKIEAAGGKVLEIQNK
ncbi:MAG TPA: 50S ribosomal protein L15, partial [Desulfobacterales bacterium]|nr:50S ribosomal protein L15 [Desulfobacterales bacterium]